MSEQPRTLLTNPAAVVDLASAFYGSAALFAALELDLFAALADPDGVTCEDLAKARAVDGRGLRLLLDACVALGLLTKEGTRYRNGPAAAACLVPGAPADLTQAIRYNRDVYAAWGRAAELVRTGHPVEAPAVHLGDDPERTRRFVLAMHGRALGIGRAVVPLLDLVGCRRLLDLGGGPGTYAALLAQANPELHCTVLDLPGIVRVARELIAASPAADRVTCLAGDYHATPYPPGQDAVTIFGALHQESPSAIRAILRRAYAALRPGGRIFVLDLMTDATHTHPRFSALFALNMALTTNHGWVFADTELCGWLAEAGFADCAVRPAPPPMPHWLVEARRPADAQGNAA